MLLTVACLACGTPGGSLCATCGSRLSWAPGLPPPLGVDAWSAALRYDDAARAVVTGLKNRQRRDLVGRLADALAGLVPAPPVDAVTWAPTGGPRRRARGFDQAELLARALARRWALPCRSLLRRRPGPPQAGRGAAERRTGPSFRAVGRAPSRVLVVDDVATTGATLTAAARALRAAGAVEVRAVVAARAPLPPGH